MTEIPSFIGTSNGDLHEFEIEYVVQGIPHGRLGQLVRTHMVKSKSVPKALASFNRAVPQHGQIVGVRRA